MSSTPMPQPEASEAVWAKYGGHSHPSCDQCHGECPMYQPAAASEEAEAWLVEVMRGFGFAPHVKELLAERLAGYVSPDRLASLLTEARAEALREAADDQEWWLTTAMDGDFLLVDCLHIGHDDGHVGLSQARPTDLSRWVAQWLRARVGGAR